VILCDSDPVTRRTLRRSGCFACLVVRSYFKDFRKSPFFRVLGQEPWLPLQPDGAFRVHGFPRRVSNGWRRASEQRRLPVPISPQSLSAQGSDGALRRTGDFSGNASKDRPAQHHRLRRGLSEEPGQSGTHRSVPTAHSTLRQQLPKTMRGLEHLSPRRG